jgi:hypothetical protein
MTHGLVLHKMMKIDRLCSTGQVFQLRKKECKKYGLLPPKKAESNPWIMLKINCLCSTCQLFHLRKKECKKYGLLPPKIAESEIVSLGHGLSRSGWSIYNQHPAKTLSSPLHALTMIDPAINHWLIWNFYIDLYFSIYCYWIVPSACSGNWTHKVME